MSEKASLFRKEAMNRITSPDQLNDHLRVTRPSVWIVLAAVILLLVGLFVWANIGDLETRANVRIMVQSGEARVIGDGQAVNIEKGMTVRFKDSDAEAAVEKAGRTADGYLVGVFRTDMDDGEYTGTIVLDSVKPISFLTESR